MPPYPSLGVVYCNAVPGKWQVEIWLQISRAAHTLFGILFPNIRYSIIYFKSMYISSAYIPLTSLT